MMDTDTNSHLLAQNGAEDLADALDMQDWEEEAPRPVKKKAAQDGGTPRARPAAKPKQHGASLACQPGTPLLRTEYTCLP